MVEKISKCCCNIKTKSRIQSGSKVDLNVNTDKNYKEILKENLVKYLQTTSLHGLKFIGDSNISEAERLFFIIAFLLSVLISSYYICAIYIKWYSTPILITTSSTSTSIASIPFPSITICNLNQARKSLVENIHEGMENYFNLQTLCRTEHKVNAENFTRTGSWEQLRKFILKVSQPCNEMLVSCRYGSIIKNCSSIFEPVLTDEGLCCTFNSVHADFMFTKYSRESIIVTGSNLKPVQWTPEAGFQLDLPDEFYPRKAVGTGVNMGLTVVVNASISDYFCSSARSVGFKMLMHSPTEMPKITNYGYLLATGMETQVEIHPILHNSADNIRKIRKRYRHCVFANEMKLKFYRTYTVGNCELECESRRLEQECGCVTYYLPRISKNTVVCGLKDIACIRRVQFESDSLRNENTSCSHCVPGCFALNYIPTTTSSELLKKDFIFRENFTEEQAEHVNVTELAVVHFFYGCNSFRARTKEEFLGFADFLANSGGILGLFLGFSMLSVIELVYYIFLVPHSIITSTMKRRRRVMNTPRMVSTLHSSWDQNTLSSSEYPSVRSYEADFRTTFGNPAISRQLKKSQFNKTKPNTVSGRFPYYN